MQLPMTGSWIVEVLAARAYAIHGDLYYELTVRREGGEGQAADPATVRMPQHALPGGPRAGQRLELSFLMGQVTGARPL